MDKISQKGARYQQVAVALARQIVEGKYAIGEKIKSRTTLSSNFNVSPETARKAITILVDLDIVEVKHGSGVRVLSRENAAIFLSKYHATNSLLELKKELEDQILQQKKDLDGISKTVTNILAQTRDINNRFPFEPFQLVLSQDSDYLGRQLKELNLWQETGATLIGIERQEELMLSPGPYAMLEKGDRIFFVGDELTYSRMKNLFL
ncbi:GntR family transcriptional regulator [Streptococcus varani]|jgi:K+/H+ antiporter YhaU regulatory subunit KhtT|uniref:GntR family transcriptional regulator n=1 Tax=Streptococcus varani TaxID=1608583 RepID=A0A0E4H5Q8_9STRE|nr:TrkA C-terminal domain-containing protein [Streptococcus varani]CQR25948.1 GntR family transcriptional regulator [Streptococcus varani]